jgi:radical SAM protein with 4Fe4S-binding SPASM domain
LQKEYDGFLSSDVVFKVCEELKKADSKAKICFHIYNEPTIDNRLCYFMHYIREHFKMDNGIFIHSNGWSLDEIIVRDLIKLGATYLCISCYTEEEYERNRIVKDKTQNLGIPIKLLKQRLDGRLKIYTQDICDEDKWESIYKMPFKCVAPKDLFLVAATGDVVACELDWKYAIKFGNVKTDSMDSICRKKIELYNQLIEDKLSVVPCNRCECMYMGC